jgi:hypothetical protein
MSAMTLRSRSWKRIQRALPLLCCLSLLLPGGGALLAQDTLQAKDSLQAMDSAAVALATKIPAAQLDALVAPIALYPDPLLAQTLVASTYPLEIVQLQQWLTKHPELKDSVLADSISKQPWDPSIQSMAAVPEVVKRLADDIQWTTELGNAFLAQQGDVMDAVQRMRKKAKDNGALKSNEQQKVDTTVVEQKTVIVVQPTNPEVIYVPTYSPTVVYGPPVYPYPPIYYPPPPPPGAYAVAFTVGVMWGAAMWGGSCCYAGWGHSNTVIINNNNNFNQINHNRGGAGGGNNNWQHNPQHRGAAPYADQRTANKYGGDRGQQGGAGQGQRGPGASTQPAGGGGQRGGGAGVSTQPAGGAGQRGGAGVSTQPAGGTRGDQIGGRDVPSSKGGQSGFSGGQGGYSGSSARASSSRGASSMSRGGGGGSRGGGGGGRRR